MKKEIPKSVNANKEIYQTQVFKGVDYANTNANIKENRAAYSINMVRSQVGKVCKRTGFEYDDIKYNEPINGIHYLKTTEKTITVIHAGTKLYVMGVAIYGNMNNSTSQSVQIAEKLLIVDAENYIAYDGNGVTSLEDYAYLPTVYENRSPSGGGVKKQSPNIITAYRKETFIADGISSAYKLSVENLDNNITHITSQDFTGKIFEYGLGIDYTVDTVNGIINFTYPPANNNIAGVANVFIIYQKSCNTPNGTKGSSLACIFGKGGAQDVLVLGGNDNYKDYTWFSYPNNPFYFPENSVVNNSFAKGKTIGYSIKDDMLYTHLSGGSNSMNIIVRKGVGNSNDEINYPVVGVMYAPDAVSSKTFNVIDNEPLFLTKEGVYAITSKEYSNEQHTQLRSLFINSQLLSNNLLNEATATVFNNFYIISVGENVYLLDSLQKSKVNSDGFLSYQYECYHWHCPKMKYIFVEDDRLCFATNDGRIGRFFKDYTFAGNYNDDGKAIECVWQTHDIYSNDISKDKKLVRMWIVTDAAVNTSVRVLARLQGVFREIFYDDKTARCFSWSGMNWARFTWLCDKTPKLISKVLRAKATDKIAIRLENNALNEPFGIQALGFEYIKGGYLR